MKCKIEDLEKKNCDADKKLKALEEWLENERSKDTDSEACMELARNIAELKKREEQLEKELSKYKEHDPQSIKRKIDETKVI